MVTRLFPFSGRLKIIVFCLALVLLPACSATISSATGNGSSNGIKYGGVVSIMPGPYDLFTRNFNPFQNKVASSGTQGMIYETLLVFNQFQVQNTVTPWLASSYKWSPDFTSLTLTLRTGVTWTDGEPFTSDDVVYTLNLLQQYPQLDTYNVSKFIKNVVNPDTQTVTIDFYRPSSLELWYIAGQTYIIPRHIWKYIKDPVTNTIPDPIGTGPFTLSSFDTALYVLTRNPHYWQVGKPYIDELRYPAYASNASADLLLAQGSIDWNGIYSAKVQENFVNRDPAHNHYWFPSVKDVMLYMNLTTFPFNNQTVRQAMSLAINRQRLSQDGENGFEPPAHQTGLVLPLHQSYLDPQYAKLSTAVNTAKARSMLEGAGFIRENDGMYRDAQGRPLSFSLNVISGWTDWESDAKYIAQDLQSVGIAVNVQHITFNDHLTKLGDGTYQAAISWTTQGPSPYYLYNNLLASANSAPIGEVAASNWERWNDATTDHLLSQFAESGDPSVQRQALQGLQKVMVESVPAIPLVYNVDWYEYTTTRFVGWPTEQDPYAAPSPYEYPDNEVVALHLHQV